ncbi:hypothetical protein PITC_061770 [Penicillium italicum]|uniref:Uncharacterized protein n=1 Tax=Penicillium italicum TaxID=40296 RepID=A0A0A2KYT8_PENIT|nr:hypothetical protein PITC_061770 [Penicillium italicum]
MSTRAFFGTYEEERRYFMTTLHAQIDILQDNHKGNRKMAVNSLKILLQRVEGLRLSGQSRYPHDSPYWTDRCNMLYDRIKIFRDTLISDKSSTSRVAADIENMMLFLDFCVPADVEYRIMPGRGDRSGAPSPEPRR